MKLIINRKQNTVPFERINSGEFFLYGDILYHKLKEQVIVNSCPQNALNLVNGVTNWFVNAVGVTPVEIEIIATEVSLPPKERPYEKPSYYFGYEPILTKKTYLD